MAHRIRLTEMGHETHTTDVLCPDAMERDLRTYLTPPLHLVAWGIMEASEVDGTWAEECDMEGIQDLPKDTNKANETEFLVNSRVRVQLLGHQEITMKRYIVSRTRLPDGTWEFEDYNSLVIDASDTQDAAKRYVKACEDDSDYTLNGDPWDGEDRPTEFGVLPMIEVASLTIRVGPDRKHLAEAFTAMFDRSAIETVKLE